jgi:enoyl-[acyl-carrier protein] reductase III
LNNSKQFSGLWGVILGGSSGFGFASMEKLASNGMNIVILYRETTGAEKLLKEKISLMREKSGVKILLCNINALEETGRSDFLRQFKKEAGEGEKIRLLLHSIARGNLKPLIVPGLPGGESGEVLTAEDIQLTAYSMSHSILDWTRMLLKEGLFCEDARIIGLTSEGSHKYWKSYAAVSIAKASLESLATYMAVELAKYGLKTNLIQAGITETPSLNKIAGSKELLQIAKDRNPMGRITIPEDVANVIYLLCTDEASWINGSVIHVDGGEHCC